MVRRCAKCSKDVVIREATNLQGLSQQETEWRSRAGYRSDVEVIIEHSRTGRVRCKVQV